MKILDLLHDFSNKYNARERERELLLSINYYFLMICQCVTFFFLYTMTEDATKVWQDVATLMESVQAKILEANEKFSSMQKQLKQSLEENSRLQVTINVLKKKTCAKCPRLIECIELLKKKLKEKDDTISVMGKFFLNQNPESYAAASQFVNQVITSSTADDSLFEKSLSCSELDVSAKPTPLPKSPDRAAIPEPTNKESPIVEKKNRSNKRKFFCISSLRRNKPLNGDPVPLVSDPIKFDDDDFNESKLLNDAENPTKIPETCDNTTESTPPQNLLASPEILSSMSQCNRSLEVENENVSKETPKFGFRRSRRSLNMNLIDADRSSSPEAKRKTPEMTRASKELKRSEPMDLEIANAIEPLPEVPVESGPKEVQPKTVWNLKRSREQLTNSKLKQTLLSTTPLEKKVDISTSSEYKGGSAVQLNVIKSDANSKFLRKENVEETFFEPAITSTHNDFDVPAQPNPAKAGALAESTNKPRTPHKIDDSFDCLPSTSPKYKYQRDAIRKKSERWKLPGQECAKCMDFYEAKRGECSDSQIRKLLNKCSRHRHKFPIQVYTPPGLWNPVFDDTDDEVDVK